jgi:hypothetical protein
MRDMKVNIIFICGSAEPGKDGVCDYTRRLCGELIRTGHDAQIIALCDQEATSFISENQKVEGTEVVVHRIPKSTTFNQRLIWSQEIINTVQPDWISLQFVPYSFNPKGLPFWLRSFLKKLKGNYKWHIMFHELWLGIDIESSFRHKCIGKLQQLIVKKLVHNINPYLINTQNKLYQFFLQSHNIIAEVLPICGNIPLTAIKKEANKCIQFVLFGTIHPGAPFKDFVNDLLLATSTFKKPIKFVFIGKNGTELSTFTAILENHKIGYEVLGVQSEDVISQVLVNSDFGISTTPYFQTEKSGVYAAYREHQINTICVSREWTPTKGQYTIPQIIKYEKNNLNLIPMNVKLVDLNSIANQFINSISTL